MTEEATIRIPTLKDHTDAWREAKTSYETKRTYQAAQRLQRAQRRLQDYVIKSLDVHINPRLRKKEKTNARNTTLDLVNLGDPQLNGGDQPT